MQPPIVRHCTCKARLARDNPGDLCASCLSAKPASLTPCAPKVSLEFWDLPAMRAALASRHMGKVIREFRHHPAHGRRPLSQDRIAGCAGLTQAQLSRIESGSPIVHLDRLIQWAEILKIPEHLLWFTLPGPAKNADIVPDRPTSNFSMRIIEPGQPKPFSSTVDESSDELESLELLRRATASNVGTETLSQLETITDDLATAYPRTPPAVLLNELRKNLRYVSHLMDSRMTLVERQRLVVVGSWLSLLTATVHIDLKQMSAATARLKTAVSLANHAGHSEIRAWCYETEAWRMLTDGHYRKAVDLSRAAQGYAPNGSSAAIQATAQEGRAWARLGQPRETYHAVDRVNKLVAPLKRSDNLEHHYRYDPDKSVAYVATTLAWLGDPAAESYAREVIARLSPTAIETKWPRRMASANLDLALSLLASGNLEEACGSALQAIISGRIVPSNHWRAGEIVSAVEARGLPEAQELREVYEDLRRMPNQRVNSMEFPTREIRGTN